MKPIILFASLLLSAPAWATPILVPVNSAYLGQPTAEEFDFPVTALNGTPLAGQAGSFDVVLADDIFARLLCGCAPSIIAVLHVDTTADTFPGFPSPGTNMFFIAPDGTPVPAPVDVAGGIIGADGHFAVGFLSPLVGPVDLAGAHFEFQFPDTGSVVTGAWMRWAVPAAARIQFGTAADVPEPASWLLLGLASLMLCGWRWIRRL